MEGILSKISWAIYFLFQTNHYYFKAEGINFILLKEKYIISSIQMRNNIIVFKKDILAFKSINKFLHFKSVILK